jgi:hypothetical protein
MELLQYTACLFSITVLHAYHLQITSYHHAFLLVTVLSILYHCTHEPWLHKLDKVVAHLAFVFILSDTPRAVAHQATWLLVFPLSVVVFWVAQAWWPGRVQELHAALHCVAVAGLSAYMHTLYY